MILFFSVDPTTREQVSCAINKHVKTMENTMVGCFSTAFRRSSRERARERESVWWKDHVEWRGDKGRKPENKKEISGWHRVEHSPRCINMIWWINLMVIQRENRVFGEEVIECVRWDARKMAGKMTIRGRKETESRKNGRERLKCLERIMYT